MSRWNPMSIADRFWEKVDRRGPDECWPWLGSLTRRGYGEFREGGPGGGRLLRAHRVAWELANGQAFPKGMSGLHSCDNPPCVNPAHIFPGTQADNIHDAMAKGRLRLKRGKVAA